MANPFTDRTKRPTDAALRKALGRTKTHWDAIRAHLEESRDDLAVEWKHYAGRYGWILKTTRKKKGVLYLTPDEGRFTAAMGLNEAAVAALKSSGLPTDVVAAIVEAKTYPEGKPARIEVTSLKKVAIVRKLVALKLVN